MSKLAAHGYQPPDTSNTVAPKTSAVHENPRLVDAYFSADVETDGPIPGPFSMLTFALVYAGTFDGERFEQPPALDQVFRARLKPISSEFESEALSVNQINREWLLENGEEPEDAMTRATEWVKAIAGGRRPILVAYPLSFDWTWLYWYFVRFSRIGSPFNHSGCYDIKTAYAVKAEIPVACAGRDELLKHIQTSFEHTHEADQDAKQQADIFIKLFGWPNGKRRHT